MVEVHVLRPRPALGGSGVPRGIIVPLVMRNPERQPPPELVGDEPTPLEPEAKRAPIIIEPLPPDSQFRMMWGITQLVRYLAIWARMKFTGKLDETRHAVLTRELFERMSGIWIKAGQLMSLRSDLISPAMAKELGSLQYQARGFSPDLARTVVEEELGCPISAVFSWFEAAPFAAASIAQVHRATLLRNNRAVVVKVMRPDVARSFARDLRLLEGLVRWSRRLGLFRRFRLGEGIAEMRAIFTEETDYQYEAVNLKRMRKNLRKHDIYVPRVIKDLSRTRVLVIEEIPGVLMSQYIHVRRDDPDRAHRWALQNGIDDKALARRLSITVLRQILEDNEFHGDMHPGNIMLLTDNRIALIDFGSVGRLTQHAWTLYRYSMAALAMRDYDRAADLMLMMSPTIAMANNKRLRTDMSAALRQWEIVSEFPAGSAVNRSMAAMSERIARVMAEHNVPLSWGVLRVGRTLSTLDASLQTLVPHTNFMTLTRAYFRDRKRRMATWEGRRQTLRAVMAQVTSLGSDVQLLIGNGVRDQALRLHGMLDRLTHIRLVVLSWLQMGFRLLIVTLIIAAVTDEVLRPWEDADNDPLPRLPVQFLLRAIPDLNPLHWVLIIIAMFFLLRMMRTVREAIARLE